MLPSSSPSLKPVDYLVIGHVTRDLVDGGDRVGGTVAYAALTAHKLGYSTGIVTAATPSLIERLRALLPGITVVAIEPSSEDTVFENTYDAQGHRTQYLRGQASILPAESVPLSWRASPICHLAPVAAEITVDLALTKPEPPRKSLRLVTPQGWLRRWDTEGRVYPVTSWHDGPVILSACDIVVFSDEDDASLGTLATRYCPLWIETRGNAGALVSIRLEQRLIPSRPAQAVDFTGAGDVFATAFTLAYYETGDPFSSATFAHAAAALSIEGVGLDAVPTRAEVLAKLSS